MTVPCQIWLQIPISVCILSTAIVFKCKAVQPNVTLGHAPWNYFTCEYYEWIYLTKSEGLQMFADGVAKDEIE